MSYLYDLGAGTYNLGAGVVGAVASGVGSVANGVGSVAVATANVAGTVLREAAAAAEVTFDVAEYALDTVVVGTCDTVGAVASGTVNVAGTVLGAAAGAVGSTFDAAELVVDTVVVGACDLGGTVVNASVSGVGTVLEYAGEGCKFTATQIAQQPIVIKAVERAMKMGVVQGAASYVAGPLARATLLPTFPQAEKAQELKVIDRKLDSVNKRDPLSKLLVNTSILTVDTLTAPGTFDDLEVVDGTTLSVDPEFVKAVMGSLEYTSNLKQYLDYFYKRTGVKFLDILQAKNQDKSFVAELGQRVADTADTYFDGLKEAKEKVFKAKPQLRAWDKDIQRREKLYAGSKSLRKGQSYQDFLAEKENFLQSIRILILRNFSQEKLHPAFRIDGKVKNFENAQKILEQQKLEHCKKWSHHLFNLLLPDGLSGMEAQLPKGGTVRNLLEPIIKDTVLPKILYKTLETISDPEMLDIIVDKTIDYLSFLDEESETPEAQVKLREIKKLAKNGAFPGLGKAVMSSMGALTPDLSRKLRSLADCFDLEPGEVIESLASKAILESLSQQNIEDWISSGMEPTLALFDAKGHLIDVAESTLAEKEDFSRAVDRKLSGYLKSKVDDGLSVGNWLSKLKDSALSTLGYSSGKGKKNVSSWQKIKGGLLLAAYGVAYSLYAVTYYGIFTPLKYLFKLPGLNYIAEKVDSIFNPKRHIHRYLNIDGNVENFQREVRRHSQPLMYAAMGVIVNGLNPNCRTGMVNP